LDTLTDEEFATNATQGHMRNFIATKNWLTFEYEGIELLKNTKTKEIIYKKTKEKIGYIGKGRFKQIKE
jgi:hypothetical protein